MAEAGAPDGGRPRAPVVVAIVVDQLSAWVATERLPRLPEAGGFARLRREGTWAQNVRLPYAVTDTGPGHAALYTGKVPAESGIWSNEVPDATGRNVSFVRDERTRILTPEGVRGAAGASAARLRADTVADRLRAARPGALVVSASLKDRGAVLPAGQKPNFALWFDGAEGTFVTSTAYGSTFPRWAASIGDARAVRRARAEPWTIANPEWLAAHVRVKDDAPGEGDLDGFGITFPHVAKSNAAFRALPATDAMLFDLALAVVDAERRAEEPTLLLLSLTASDVVGHVFGPDSWEAWEHLYELDGNLARFLDALERRVGDVAVVLAADHGNSSMPETVRARRPASCDGPSPPPPDPYERPICTVGTRIQPSELLTELEAEAARALGPGRWIEGVAEPWVFLDARARGLDPTRRARLDAAVRRPFERRKQSVELVDARALATSCPSILVRARGIPERALPGEDVLTLVCRSWSPDFDAGDAYFMPKRGSILGSDIIPGKGGGHGGPYLYDRTVPLLVRARGAAAEGAVLSDPVDFTAVSDVLASLLGLDSRSPGAILSALRAR